MRVGKRGMVGKEGKVEGERVIWVEEECEEERGEWKEEFRLEEGVRKEEKEKEGGKGFRLRGREKVLAEEERGGS